MICFGIDHAAYVLDVPPFLLLLWEEKDLISPHRAVTEDTIFRIYDEETMPVLMRAKGLIYAGMDAGEAFCAAKQEHQKVVIVHRAL